MKFRTKIFLGIIALIALLQLPFLLNRFDIARQAEQIKATESRISQNSDRYTDFKGVFHVHSFLGGHSTGTFGELLAAANSNELDFVGMTEHTSDDFDTSGMTLRGNHSGILFIGGNETSTGDGNRLLVMEGYPELPAASKATTDEFIADVHRRDGIALVTYPSEFRSWNAEYDGIEVLSLHTSAKRMNPLLLTMDMLWSFRSHPAITFARHLKRPDELLELYDEQTKRRRIPLLAGADAHSNLGFHIGDDSNNKYLNLKIDRYQTIFGILRTRVLLPAGEKLTKSSLLHAVKNGNCYVGMDILGSTAGFRFEAENRHGTAIQGESLAWADGGTKLRARTPAIARFVVFRNGERIYETGQSSGLNFDAKSKGVYRIELYRDDLGKPFDSFPWIISNPIYIN